VDTFTVSVVSHQSCATIVKLTARPRHRARDLFVFEEPTILEIAGEGSESSYYAVRIVDERRPEMLSLKFKSLAPACCVRQSVFAIHLECSCTIE